MDAISIHASAREATRRLSMDFNAVVISIHASAREATTRNTFLQDLFYYFNPRLREGGDFLLFLLL